MLSASTQTVNWLTGAAGFVSAHIALFLKLML